MNTILFGIKCDVPNANGRIYPRSLVEKMVEKMNQKKTLITSKPPMDAAVDLTDTISVVQSALINEYGRVEIVHTPINGLDELFAPHISRVVTAGIGSLKDDTVQDDYKLLCLYITPRDDLQDITNVCRQVGAEVIRLYPFPEEPDLFFLEVKTRAGFVTWIGYYAEYLIEAIRQYAKDGWFKYE